MAQRARPVSPETRLLYDVHETFVGPGALAAAARLESARRLVGQESHGRVTLHGEVEDTFAFVALADPPRVSFRRRVGCENSDSPVN